ncbi:hypothetical protein Rcae01_04507 [Novipirellula caenicola]|uniref:DoxX n=2 Tax=Novipirellula caenicola TaxID=1536901 RepID=A0ABP9VV75_9BACT
MIAPILMLTLLVAPYIICRLLHRIHQLQHSAAIGVGMMLMLTGSSHFVRTQQMTQMLPEFMPLRYEAVLITGILEWVLALLVVFPATRPTAAVAVLVMLMAFLPVNIYSAWVEAPVGGHQWGISYLILRIPLQLFIAGWVWYWLLSRRTTPSSTFIR